MTDLHKKNRRKKKAGCINVNVNINICEVGYLSSELLDVIKDEIRAFTEELQALIADNEEEIDDDSATVLIKPKVSTKKLIPSQPEPFDDDDD